MEVNWGWWEPWQNLDVCGNEILLRLLPAKDAQANESLAICESFFQELRALRF